MPGSMSGATRNLLLTVALGAVCSVGPVQAAEQQRLSREAYAAAKDTIAERHDKALAHCNTGDGGAQSRCRMQADGRVKIDLATLEVRWHPSANNNFKASMAEVDLAYALALDQCKKQHIGVDKESKAALKSCSDKAKGKQAGEHLGLLHGCEHHGGGVDVARERFFFDGGFAIGAVTGYLLPGGRSVAEQTREVVRNDQALEVRQILRTRVVCAFARHNAPLVEGTPTTFSS